MTTVAALLVCLHGGCFCDYSYSAIYRWEANGNVTCYGSKLNQLGEGKEMCLHLKMSHKTVGSSHP